MKHAKNIFLASVLAGLLITAARAGERETVNYITSTNIKMPKGSVYRRGESLPIVVEIQNKTVYPLPLREINGMKRFRITDGGGNVIAEGGLWNHISPWEYTEGSLKPAETISDTFYFERLPFRMHGNFPTQINIQFETPIQDFERGRRPKIKYTYGVPIELRDQPFEYGLISDDLPEKWTTDMDIFLQEAGGIVYRYSAIHIEGSGRVTTIRNGIQDANFPIKTGRNEFNCTQEELNGILEQLRNFKIERLKAYDSERRIADGITISISIAKGGKVFCGDFPAPDNEVWALRQIIVSLIIDEFNQ